MNNVVHIAYLSDTHHLPHLSITGGPAIRPPVRPPVRPSVMVFRRFMSTRAAHRLVQQRVQTQLSLAASSPAPAPATRVLFVARPATPAALQEKLPFAVSPAALADFQARAQEKLYLYPSEGASDQRALLVGLGAEEKVSENLLRDATHGALAALRAKRAKNVLLHVPALLAAKISPERVVELVSQVRPRLDGWVGAGRTH